MAVTRSGKDKTVNYARIFVGGYDLSGDALTFSSAENQLDPVQITGWSDAFRLYRTGVRSLGIRGFQAIMNDDVARSWLVLKDSPNTLPVSLCFGGSGEPTIGDPSYHIPCMTIGDIVNLSDGVAVLQCDFIVDPDELTSLTKQPSGFTLYGASLISATTNANSVDNEASTLNGAWAMLHVISQTTGDFVFKVQHSTNDADWSDLMTFTDDGSANNTYEIKTASGTINQYVRFQATRTTGSVTVVCTFSRN